MKKEKMVRVTVSLPESLLKRVDVARKERRLSRSQYIELAIRWYFELK